MCIHSSDSQLLAGGKYTRKLSVQRSKAGDELKIHYISLDRVGMDVHEVFTPKYTSTKQVKVNYSEFLLTKLT